MATGDTQSLEDLAAGMMDGALPPRVPRDQVAAVAEAIVRGALNGRCDAPGLLARDIVRRLGEAGVIRG